MRQAIFNNKEVSAMLDRYSRHPHSRQLRQQIMERAYPLIDAAITRKNLFLLRDDLRQECALKILKALPKFRAKRGSAFAFLWSTICNTLKTQGKRLSKGGLSLGEEDINREAENAGQLLVSSPEFEHMRRIIGETIDQAIISGELRIFYKDKERKALVLIRQSVLNGDLFGKKLEVLKGLKRIGVRKKDAMFLMNYVIVNLRSNLYSQKEMLFAIASRKAGADVPSQPD